MGAVCSRPARSGSGEDRAGLALADGGGRRLLFCATDRDDELGVDWCEVAAHEDVPLTHSARTGEQVVGSLADLAGRYPAFTRRPAAVTCALASVPIVTAGHVQGGYWMFHDTPQRFDDRQLTDLQELGTRLGAELRRIQRDTTYASRSLADEPVPDGALTATYVVAGEPQAVAPARHFTRGVLGAWGVDPDTIDIAVLCLSELVTNAIIHTKAGCELRVVLDRGCSPRQSATAARPSLPISADSPWDRSRSMGVGSRSWASCRGGGGRSSTPSG